MRIYTTYKYYMRTQDNAKWLSARSTDAEILSLCGSCNATQLYFLFIVITEIKYALKGICAQVGNNIREISSIHK